MKLNKLDWSVEKVLLNDSVTNVATPFYATKRMDNGKHLSVVSKNYPIIQNHQLLDICQELCNKTGYELYFEECLDGGKKVMLSLLCGKVKVGDDEIYSQISVANSHTATTSVAFSILDDTIRCANRFNVILKKGQFRFNHDSFVFDNINKMINSIKELNTEQTKHYNNLERFVSTPLSKDLALKMIGNVLDIEFDYDNDIILFDEDLSTRKKNIFERFESCYEKESEDLGNTLYTVYNSATRYSTHILKQPLIGSGLKISNHIYNKCLELI